MAFDPFKCPTSEALPTLIGLDTCATSIDQTQRIAFQKKGGEAFTTTTVVTLAAWEAALAASEPDKCVVSPYFQKLTITPGEVIETADVQNLNGMPQHEGFGFTVVTAEIHNVPHSVVTDLKKLTQLSSATAGLTKLTGYFFGENARITGNVADTAVSGIPIYNFTISDVMTEGKRKPNVWKVKFLLADGWSESINTYSATSPFDPVNL